MSLEVMVVVATTQCQAVHFGFLGSATAKFKELLLDDEET